MKRFLIFFITCALSCGCTPKDQNTIENIKNEFLGAGYHRFSDHVDYHNRIIPNADPKTFKLLNSPIWTEYAIDKERVFGFGKELTNADLTSFQTLSFRYAKDKNKVYCFGDTLESADAKTFETSEFIDPYAKDKNYTYFNCKILDEESETFEVLAPMIAKNKNNVFCHAFINTEADAQTYHILPSSKQKNAPSSLYAKDTNNVYFNCSQILKYADTETFKIIDINLAMDKNNLYKGNQIIPQ